MTELTVLDDRKAAFVKLITDGMPPQTAGRRVGVGDTTSQRWAILYRGGGAERLASRDRVAVRYPFEVKIMAVRARILGASEHAVLEAFGLRSSGTLLRWVRAYQQRGAAGIGGTEADEVAVVARGVTPVRERGGLRHSDETRRLFADTVTAGHGYEGASKIVGIPVSTGWAWYQKYQCGGALALTAVSGPSRYSVSQKLGAAKAIVDDGYTRAEAMAQFKVGSHTTLNAWVQRYRLHGDDAFTARATLPRTTGRGSAWFTLEREALTEVIARLDPGMSIADKVRIVTSLSEKYPVRPLLRALGLAPSTYYYHRGRPPKKDRYESVRPVLREAFATAYNAYGYRRMRMQLRQKHGVALSGKTVRRLMAEEGCRCVARRKKRRRPEAKPNPANVFAPNLFARDFAASAPGVKWVTDVTQFTIAGELLFLSPLIDLFNGEVLSYRLGVNQQMPLVLGMLHDAIPRVRTGVTTLHSDRGWQYQHAGFRRALRQHGITQSMSRSGNCYDNACAESFFSHFKQEFLRGRKFVSVGAFTTELASWIHWFNTDRLSERRDWLSPHDYRLKVAASSSQSGGDEVL